MSRMILRIISALLAMVLVLSFAACSSQPTAPSTPGNEPESADEELIIPDNEGHLPSGVKFPEIVYARPDIEALSASFTAAEGLISDGDASLYDQINSAIDIKNEYNEFLSMYLYATIMLYGDSTNEFYAEEGKFFNEKLPMVEALYEKVLIACAASDHYLQFAGEVFGFAPLEPYISGASMSETVAALRASEASLISEYSAIISAGELSGEALSERALDIYIQLVEIRSRIASELGYGSYTDYIYATKHTDYTSEQLDKLYSNIANYVVPVYNKLATRVLNSNSRHPVDPHTKNRIINRLSEIYSEMDEDVSDIFSYMLYHGLFNIEPDRNGRFPMSLTTYLPSYKSPYLYATMRDSLTDYMLICHEFGHFYDAFVNGGLEGSLDLMETSSQAMELLTLTRLGDVLTTKEYKYLSCMEIEDVLITIIDQSVYSKFEHYVYDLPYNRINSDGLADAASAAFAAMGVSGSGYQSVNDLIVPHLILEPFYTQTYVTSAFISLEIYFEEIETEGRGLAIYKSLIHRTQNLDLLSYVDLVGLGSPFDADAVKSIADSIHYNILGSHYFEEGNDNNTALIPQVKEGELAA